MRKSEKAGGFGVGANLTSDKKAIWRSKNRHENATALAAAVDSKKR
ncbi:hypothetical protein [Dechloromonas denitrificans]|nr:hypothetical protein [Dechloromonas denitrificans]